MSANNFLFVKRKKDKYMKMERGLRKERQTLLRRQER